ncbi:MAG TPA: hypothetical protein VGM05_28765 [Planctomycetaceae bacterium]|jgi:hypothetical protein
MAGTAIELFGWERTARAVEKVKDRLRRASSALGQAGVAYAVVGGNAVAEWVGRVDEAAVRNTQDVDILLRRTDLGAAKTVMESAGFVHCQTLDVEMFLDGPDGRPKDAIHIFLPQRKCDRITQLRRPMSPTPNRPLSFKWCLSSRLFR